MAVTEDDRLRLRLRLNQAIGEDAAAVLMEAVPPLDYDQFATKTDVELLGRELRAEMATRFAAVDQRFAEIDQRFANIDQRFANLEGAMAQGFAALDRRSARDLRIVLGAQFGWMLAVAGFVGFG